MSESEAPVTETPVAETRAHAEAPVHVSRLGYLSFETPDVQRLTEYYTDVLGFVQVDETPQQVFLTTGVDHHCTVIEKAKAARGRAVVGWEIRQSVSEAATRLRRQGHEVEVRSDIAPGVPEVLVMTEPLTGSALHLYQSQEPSGVRPSYDHRPSKLGHAASYTSSAAEMRAFYEQTLGFRWADSIGDFFVFMRCNADHHAANFMQSDKMTGMHHVAYEARDAAHLQSMLDNLSQNGYQLYWGPGRHAVGHNIFSYHEDPDGNHIELFTQLDVMLDEEKGYYEPRPWHEEYPMTPRTWEADAHAMNMWGPAPTRPIPLGK
ncbi:MAG TPA: VOC family protein [Pseudolysinimonas sp.]|nr:VOC family protein [Pseudolysinimonas sp.]